MELFDLFLFLPLLFEHVSPLAYVATFTKSGAGVDGTVTINNGNLEMYLNLSAISMGWSKLSTKCN